MKKYGKIVDFNGVFGNIKGIDGLDYILLDKNLIDIDVSVLDNVEFQSELYKTPEVEVQMAMFVKSLTKEQERQKGSKQ